MNVPQCIVDDHVRRIDVNLSFQRHQFCRQRLVTCFRLEETNQSGKTTTIGTFALIAPIHQGNHAVVAGRDVSCVIHVIFQVTVAYPCRNVELVGGRFCQQHTRFQELIVIHEPGEETLDAHLSFFVVEESFERGRGIDS